MRTQDVTKSMLEEIAKVFNKNLLEDTDHLPVGRKIPDDINIYKEMVQECTDEILLPEDKGLFTDDMVEVMRAIEVDVDDKFGLEKVVIEETPEEMLADDIEKSESTDEKIVIEDVVVEGDKVENADKTVTAEKVKKAVEKVKKEKKAKDKKSKYTRVQAFCDALKGDPKTLEEIMKQSNDLYNTNNNINKSIPKTLLHAVKNYYIDVLITMDIIEYKDNKYNLICN